MIREGGRLSLESEEVYSEEFRYIEKGFAPTLYSDSGWKASTVKSRPSCFVY